MGQDQGKPEVWGNAARFAVCMKGSEIWTKASMHTSRAKLLESASDPLVGMMTTWWLEVTPREKNVPGRNNLECEQQQQQEHMTR